MQSNVHLSSDLPDGYLLHYILSTGPPAQLFVISTVEQILSCKPAGEAAIRGDRESIGLAPGG